MSKTYSKTRILVECALMIAIGTVLSNIKFFTLPNGGSVTLLSMLPFVLVWGNLNEGLSAWTYSLVYNGSYMLPETLLTMVAAVLLCRVAPQIFDRQHAKA